MSVASGSGTKLRRWRSAFDRIATPGTTTPSRVAELLVFALLLPVAGWFLHARDPAGLALGMPWILFGPILFTVRYGLAWGGASAALATGLLFVPGFLPDAQAGMRVPVAIGIVVLTVLCGEIVRAGARRSARHEAENQYLRQRLEEFATDYHVLKVSHGHLEEHLAGQRLSLREALQKLKPECDGDGFDPVFGEELLAIFAQFCSVHIAGLYPLTSDGDVDVRAIAELGDMGELPPGNPMIEMAITRRQLVNVRHMTSRSTAASDELLAVLPIADSAGEVHALLAIRDMHFLAYQQQNLNLMALLGDYTGNLLRRSRDVRAEGIAGFLEELDTVLRFASSHRIESSLVSFVLPADDVGEAAARFVADTVRSLDAAWQVPHHEHDEARLVAVLLPLMTAKQSAGFVARAERSLAEKFHSRADMLLSVDVLEIGEDDTRESCFEFFVESLGQRRVDALASATLPWSIDASTRSSEDVESDDVDGVITNDRPLAADGFTSHSDIADDDHEADQQEDRYRGAA